MSGLDLKKTKVHFLNLSHEEQIHELTSIFERIKDKNKNCGYIYDMLSTRIELFDKDLVEDLFDEVLLVYNQIWKNTAKIAQEKFLFIQQKIKSLQDLEQKERDNEEPEILLNSL